MNAVLTARRDSARRLTRRRGASRERVDVLDLPPLTPRAHLARTLLVAVAVMAGGLLLHVTVLSSLQHRSSQQRLYDDFRARLAEGTAPIGPTDIAGAPVVAGDPVAYLEIPAVGVRQVVVEGTSSGVLVAGPGHRRDTPLPGQEGISVLYGRQATFGGPFGRIHELEAGDDIRVTTGQGTFSYAVLGVRRDGDPLPAPPERGDGRLLLATADGRPLVPTGVVRVDAQLDGEAGAAPARPAGPVPAAEGLLGTDRSGFVALALWLEVLVAVSAAGVWAWHRWGRPQAWIVFLPPLALVSTYVSGHLAELLPNLL